MLMLCGCARSNQLPVRGEVSYNGKPLETGRVGFYPQGGRPAYGEIKDGKFTLTTYKPGDGALLGIHRVTVASIKLVDPNHEDSASVSLIPERYQRPETSGLTADVKPGNTRFHFELTD